MSKPVIKGSIRNRLIFLLLFGAAVMAILLYFLIQSIARQTAQSSQDNILTASAISIMDSIRFNEGEVIIDLPYSSLSMLDSITDERAFYAIWQDGKFLSGYSQLPIPEKNSSTAPAVLTTNFLGERVRVIMVRRSISLNEKATVIDVGVAQTLTGLNNTIQRISRNSIGVGIVFFLVSATLAFFATHSAMRPIKRLTLSVSRRGPKDLRPVAAAVPYEMAPLVQSLNNLMQRLKISLNRSEEFIAEAAHRVRTPLAIVRTKADIILRRVEKPENRTALREIIRAIDESSRAAGQLLDHAMVTFRADDLVLSTIDLGQLLNETVERLTPIAELRDLSMSVEEYPKTITKADPILLQNALHNVLDNAIKYSPREGHINILLSHQKSWAIIKITDTGPGFPENDKIDLTARFERGENSATVIGSGLGLTITVDALRAHGGHIKIANTKRGGACVSLFLPLT